MDLTKMDAKGDLKDGDGGYVEPGGDPHHPHPLGGKAREKNGRFFIDLYDPVSGTEWSGLLVHDGGANDLVLAVIMHPDPSVPLRVRLFGQDDEPWVITKP
jgi:hypothetical protein